MMSSDSNMHNVSIQLRDHYSQKFTEFGATPKGVDWGKKDDVLLRYEKMLNVIERGAEAPSLLDVGCGYGGLYIFAIEQNLKINYTGIDVSENMIAYARKNITDAQFYEGDILAYNPPQPFDYVVCNGVLTQKLKVSIRDMDDFSHLLIPKMFSLCSRGIVFNIMTSKVNYMEDNLYYRNPVELFAFCLTNITRRIKIDHSYLYEYSVYLYRE
jgi:SAM-dependent methyltransferase